ncbi:MAG: hypothetical protein NTV58_15110 [Deltaproteobacteria bacterium]|nr:hypothetical protein [Deltaproteobacteria bacterium]
MEESERNLVTPRALVEMFPWVGTETSLSMDRARGVGLPYYRLRGKKKILYSPDDATGALQKVPVGNKGAKGQRGNRGVVCD